MFIQTHQHDPEHIYHLLIQTVIPRPIAWVLSDNGNATYNLAPFSFFNLISADPPIFMISVGWKNEQTHKDTWTNIEQRNDFVVHIPSVNHAQQVTDSAASFPHGISEVDSLRLPLARLEGQHLPYLRDSKIALFCQKRNIVEMGNDRQGVIFGEIKYIWIADDIVTREGDRWQVDPKALNPLARLGGNDYSTLGDILTIKRNA